jgi:hypothetical protein
MLGRLEMKPIGAKKTGKGRAIKKPNKKRKRQ